ncbi:SIMPL domain-containing protein [Rubrivirga sp.]|uniref:SIMPL domain-containing protein n=1 Tax=Rubrivirga sp. TaxID=1885344 RepID=UPI003B51A898
MRTLLLALALLAAPAVAAQSVELDLDAGTITVVGSATVTAPPDRAVVRLGVQTRARTAAEALRQHEDDVARVLTQVRTFGVPDRQIVIEGLSLGENYGRDGPDGFIASRVVSVSTDSLRVVPELVASVVEVGANRLDGLFYTIKESGPYQDQALAQAMDRARAKAERLATAAGRRLGGVVAIVEQGGGVMQPFQRGPVAYDEVVVESMSAEPAAYSAGSSQVQASVVVRFTLGS